MDGNIENLPSIDSSGEVGRKRNCERPYHSKHHFQGVHVMAWQTLAIYPLTISWIACSPGSWYMCIWILVLLVRFTVNTMDISRLLWGRDEPPRTASGRMSIQEAMRIVADTHMLRIFAPEWVRRLPLQRYLLLFSNLRYCSRQCSF